MHFLQFILPLDCIVFVAATLRDSGLENTCLKSAISTSAVELLFIPFKVAYI